jgi:hypothetical protein
MPSIPLEELLADLGLSDQEDEDDMRKTRHWKSCTCATIIFEILYIKKLLHFCGAIKTSIEYSTKNLRSLPRLQGIGLPSTLSSTGMVTLP